MMGGIVLIILLSSTIICEAQYHNCFMSGSYSGRSTWCGENLKDEENLKDPVEIMKRAKEFLQKQNEIILDPMFWTIPPPSSPPSPPSPSISSASSPPPPPSINAASGTTISNPLLQPGVTGARPQPQYIPFYSVALPNGANSFFTPTSKNPSDISSLQTLPFIGIITPRMSHGHQNTHIFTGQANLPFGYENSEQIIEQKKQFQIQPNYLANTANEIPLVLKISPLQEFFVEKRDRDLKGNINLTDMRDIEPIRLVLNQHQHSNSEESKKAVSQSMLNTYP